MGGSASKTRKLTVENEDPASVIKVSEDVVDRIRGSQINQTVRQEPKSQGFVPPAPPAGYISGSLFLNEPSLTSLQLRQNNVVELTKNDDYWQQRLKNMEGNHKKINEIMDQEYNKAIAEFQGKKRTVAKSIEPPCIDSKRAVTECYKCYPDEPMRCAKVVQAFQECVDMKRHCLMQNRG